MQKRPSYQFGSELYDCFYQDNVYVAPEKMVDLEFLRQCLDGRKNTLSKDRLIPIFNLERFPELTLQKMLDFAREQLPEALTYLPDNPQPSSLDRLYVASVCYLSPRS